MSAPQAGWATAPDDDESQLQARPPAGSPDVPGRVNPTSYRERGSRGSRLPSGPPPARPAVSVLADRLAAALVHHEPGWRLPRHSALARRYNVSVAEIDAAVGELVSRHLVRRLA